MSELEMTMRDSDYILHQIMTRLLSGLLHFLFIVRQARQHGFKQLTVRKSPFFPHQHELSDPRHCGQSNELVLVMSLRDDGVDLHHMSFFDATMVLMSNSPTSVFRISERRVCSSASDSYGRKKAADAPGGSRDEGRSACRTVLQGILGENRECPDLGCCP